MTYEELVKEAELLQEELIDAGFVELIPPYFFVSTDPDLAKPVHFQQMDRFVFLITLKEQVMNAVPKEMIRNILIQQMLHACEDAKDESIRWKTLIEEVNQAMHVSIPQHEYELSEVLDSSQLSAEGDTSGRQVAQACLACGYKSMVPRITPYVKPRIVCPMCEQDSCVQCY